MKNTVGDGTWQTQGVQFCKKMILKWKQGYENSGQMALGKVGELAEGNSEYEFGT